MVNLQLAHYIEKELERGFSNEQVKQQLSRYGHSEQEIDGCLAYLQNTKVQNRPTEPHLPSHNKIYLIVGAVVMAIVASLLILSIFTSDDKPDRLQPAVNTTEPGEPGSEIVLENQSVSILPGIHSQEGRERAYEQMVSECIEQNKYHSSMFCRAAATDDISNCETEDCLDEYYMYAAYGKKDAAICNNIKSDRIKAGCKAIIGGDMEKCGALGGSDRVTCEAAVSLDQSKCAALDGDEPGVCATIVLVLKAIANKDPTYCSYIMGPRMHQSCYAILEKDIEYCYNRPGCQIQSSFRLARMTGDSSECNKLPTDKLKDECIAQIT